MRKISFVLGWGIAVAIFLFLVFLNFYPVGSFFENTIIKSTKIYDRNGILLYETLHPEQGKTTQVPLDQISKHLIKATIAVEDQNFYEHSGIDISGIFRAAYLNAKERRVVSGGSTIPQQLVRNVIGTQKKRTILQKIKESLLALRISKVYSKDEILYFYFNKIYYGNLNYGVGSASFGYFGKSVSDLDLAESAFLAGLPQAPARYDPFQNRQDATARKDYVLALMRQRDLIANEDMEEAQKEPLSFEQNLVTVRAGHFVNYVIENLEDRFGENFVSSGLEVKTTLDYHLYQKVQNIARRNIAILAGRNVTNASVMVTDPQTAEILTMMGSIDYFDPSIDGEVNIALRRRQPGSAIKPITYAVAFEKGWNGATLLKDEPVRFFTADGTPYIPKNYDYEYHGLVTVREALANSYNIPAVLAINFAGVPAVLEKAREMGLTTLEKSADHYGLALTLGDGEVRLLDLTSAYMIFANGGIKKQPQAILEVRDASGNILFSKEEDAGERVLGEDTSFMITDILSDNKARIAEFGINTVLELEGERLAAVKTGTTRNFRDNWTVGYTPDFVVGVWVGNSDNSAMHNITGIYGAGPIWHDVMEELHRGREKKLFPVPQSVEKKEFGEISEWVPKLWTRSSTGKNPMLRIKKPFDFDVFQFNPLLDPLVQQIKFEIEKDPSVREITWLVNGKKVGKGDEIFWSLQKGYFEIQAKSGEEVSSSIHIKVMLQ